MCERWKYRVIDAGLISISVSTDWLDGPVNQPIFNAYWSCPVPRCCRPPFRKTVSPVNLCPICVSTPLPSSLLFFTNNKRGKIDEYIYIYAILKLDLKFRMRYRHIIWLERFWRNRWRNKERERETRPR